MACLLVKEKLKIEVSASDITAAHRFETKQQSQAADERPLIEKFCRRDTKRDLLIKGQQSKVPIFLH